VHKHWCDFAGHYWDCPGAAVRLFQNDPTACMCLQHGVPVDDGDHSECSIELLACPEHRADQMRAMGYAPDHVFEQQPDEESSMFTDSKGNRTVGFCLWCGCDFYSFEDHEAHVANDMAACPVFREYKDKCSTPPLLEAMFEAAGLTDDESENDGE